jgi:hypothetical protein
MKVRALIVGLLLAAVTAFAADVDGKWSGTVNTPNGDFPVTFEFMAAAAALNGSMLGMDGMKIPIKDGKVDGRNISFSVTLDFGGMPFTLNYKGWWPRIRSNSRATPTGSPSSSWSRNHSKPGSRQF